MQEHVPLQNVNNKMPYWVTIQEAVDIVNKQTTIQISESDIYRHALYGTIFLSIYFQSSIKLRKIKLSGGKISLTSLIDSLVNRLCLLDNHSFLNRHHLMTTTIGEYISPPHNIVGTALMGHEYVEIQRLLANSLRIQRPVKGAEEINYGISVMQSGEIFQVFEKTSWGERIKQQIMRLPKNIGRDIYQRMSSLRIGDYRRKVYFPLYSLPKDACFVIRKIELEKITEILLRPSLTTSVTTRISTPLSRLFWLACQNNDIIKPLINQPYKLVSIFEQWALADGMSDRLSGDTLKTALERGKPTSI